MTEVPIPKDRWSGKVGTVVLGVPSTDESSRSRRTAVGGELSMPFLSYEGRSERPIIAGEVLDSIEGIPEAALGPFLDVANDISLWARTWVEEHHADAICIKLRSTDPETKDTSPEEAARTVERIAKAVSVPLIVYGCSNEEKDARTMEAVSNRLPKERLLLGHAEEGAYKSLAAASMSNDHGIISFSNLDINLAKQINILLTDFGVKIDNIVVDPLMAGLGMGLEYSYSVNERIRLAALMGDRMLQTPMICDTSTAWEAREATDPSIDFGDMAERGMWWEATTGLAALLSGADILVVRNPGAASILREAISELRGE